jgi:hypothetical protein
MSSKNIARYYPTGAYGTAAQSGTLPSGTRYGHRTKNGGTMAAGSAVPCRSCHNPHGGAGSGRMLVVRTQINSTVDTMVGDVSGELTMTGTPSAANVRNFCLTCHTTSDTTGQGWNGSSLVNITSGEVLGINRTITGAVLKLPALDASVDGHEAADVTSCYTCHGNSYTTSTSANVHNPSSGESRGGIACYVCHGVYKSPMEDGSGAATGTTRTNFYHHVLGGTMGTTYYDGDTTSSPTFTSAGSTNVFCLSCHVDHNLFSPAATTSIGVVKRGANLRLQYGTTTPANASDATNTDFVASGGTNGVCLGCHSSALQRDNTSQTAETNSTTVPTITAAAYDPSAHDYTVNSTFSADSTNFKANCAKCHDTEFNTGGVTSASYQTAGSPNRQFSVHYSKARRILGAMGVTITDPPHEEDVCYKCHSVAGATPAGDGFKTTANRDWYGDRTMDAASQNIYDLIQLGYAHKVETTSGVHRPSTNDENRAYITANKHVECADCHDVHAANSNEHTMSITTGNRVSGALAGVSGAQVAFPATSWTAPTQYSSLEVATYEYQICFKCHSAYNQNTQNQPAGTTFTTLITWGGSGAAAWTDQGLEFSPQNQSYHPVVAALPATDPGLNGSSQLQANDMRATAPTGGTAWHIGDTMYCSDCHAQSLAGSLGPHGSAVKWMLKGPNQAWPYTTAAANGTSSGTYRTYGTRADNPDAANGLFCNNCHVFHTGDTGKEHTLNDHNVACVTCHIRVPHGGKVSRLMNSGPAANVPPRYRADGNGNPVNVNIVITRFLKNTTGAYGASNCSVTGCSSHGDITTYEAW